PGGRHVFTVPFHQPEFLDDVRARSGSDGEPALLADPIYHDDPVRPGGVLVYTIFGLEMLVRLAELGFSTRMYALWDPLHGILGPNALVFEAVKPGVGSAPITVPHRRSSVWRVARAMVDATGLERPARALVHGSRRLLRTQESSGTPAP